MDIPWKKIFQVLVVLGIFLWIKSDPAAAGNQTENAISWVKDTVVVVFNFVVRIVGNIFS